MKKIFSAFIIAVGCMFMAMPAQAQLIKWGVKGGVNLTKIDWDGGYKGNKDNSAGFFIGPMAEITIPIVGLGVDGAVWFTIHQPKGNTIIKLHAVLDNINQAAALFIDFGVDVVNDRIVSAVFIHTAQTIHLIVLRILQEFKEDFGIHC